MVGRVLPPHHPNIRIRLTKTLCASRFPGGAVERSNISNRVYALVLASDPSKKNYYVTLRIPQEVAESVRRRLSS